MPASPDAPTCLAPTGDGEYAETPAYKEARMGGNKIVVYKEPGRVVVEDHDPPKLEVPVDVSKEKGLAQKAVHGVILRCVATNICGSDQHMVRGRTTAPPGQTLGHEITGEIVEKGEDVQFLDVGDIVSVPFNIACGRCRNCREGATGVCLNVNPARAGSAYGYVDMGGWEGRSPTSTASSSPTGSRRWRRSST
jgi:glutathione-independent formaldehyde dehydrogenase